MLAYLFDVTPESVFTMNSFNHAILNGKRLTGEQLRSLQNEAKYIKSTYLWKILTETVQHKARKSIFDNSQTLDDIRTGKMLLYAVDIQQKIVDNICTSYEENKEGKG